MLISVTKVLKIKKLKPKHLKNTKIKAPLKQQKVTKTLSMLQTNF